MCVSTVQPQLEDLSIRIYAWKHGTLIILHPLG